MHYTPKQVDVEGFSVTSEKDVAELNKALAIDDSHPPTTGASALRAYSIDATLRTVSYTQKQIKFWNRITRVPAYSTVEEYAKIEDYGNSFAGAFTNAGALPTAHDSNFSRENKSVKYLGTTRAVQHPATLVRTAATDSLIATEQVNGTIFLLGVIERSLFDGDPSVIPQEWAGLGYELEAEHASNPLKNLVIDMRGAALSRADLNDGATVVLNNYGVPSAFYSDLLTMSDLNVLYQDSQRFNDGNSGANPGIAQEKYRYMPGQFFDFVPDVFIRRDATPQTVVLTGAPGAPEIDSATAGAVGGGEVSQFDAVDVSYKVSAVVASGESLPSALEDVTVTAGQKVTIVISQPNANTYAATGFRIYRKDPGQANYVLLKSIPVSVGATTTFTDLNENLPGTANAYLIQEDSQNIAFKQLAPFTKIPLATIDASIRWMQLLYGVPILFTPTKNVMFKNVGRRSGTLLGA